MSVKQKIQVKFKQRFKRQKRKLRLLKKGLDPKDFFFGKFYIGSKKA